MYIDHNSHIALWLTMMDCQQSLILCWRSFSRWGRERLTYSVACKGCQYFVYDYLQPVIPPDYSTNTTNNHCHSVDTQFQDSAGRVSQSVLPIKVANECFMTIYNQSAVWLPRTHDQQSLMLCSCSVSRWGKRHVAIILANKGGQHFRLFIKTTQSILNYMTYITYNCWRSVNAHFAMGVSPICNHLIWRSPLFTLFWQSF